MNTLVQELRAQLERVVRDPNYTITDPFGAIAPHSTRFWSTWKGEKDYQAWRVAVLTAAIRAAVVTREAQP